MNPGARGTRSDPLADHVARAAERAGATFEYPVAIERTPLGSGWYATERVTATFPSGRKLECFLKDFGSFAASKNKMAERRERERFFYKEVIPDGELGVARFIGDVWLPEEETRWLLIEFVEGVPLSWCGMETWYEAAGWLGKLRAHVAPRVPELIESGMFREHGPRYFKDHAERAVGTAGTYSAPMRRLVEGCTSTYLESALDLAAGTKTLVHGAFRPDQILVDTSVEPPRICPTDWEISAIGWQLYDLATLADGFAGSQLEELAASYRSGAGSSGAGCTVDDLQKAVDTCRIHRTMKWIGTARKRRLPEEKVAELVGALTATAERMGMQ